MKKLLTVVALLLVAGLAALARTFTAEVLPAGADFVMAIPDPHPPTEMRIAMIESGYMKSQAGFAFRGGAMAEPRQFNMGGFLVEHPQGTLLFDAGFGRNVDEHFKTIPLLMRLTSTYQKETPVADQLRAAGIEPKSLKGIVLTHAHWDHVSGLDDMRDAPVWLTGAELDFIHSGDPATQLARSFGELNWHVYEFPNGPYLGFDKSYDIFGDGAVVLVPAPGHTPGSVIAFVNTPDGKRYALIGDIAWQTEGVELPAQRPWLSRRLVDHDEDQVAHWLEHLHRLKASVPGLIIVPAHDRRVADSLPRLSRTS
jgi:N-acyl homoserine lactone hydrolase